MDQNPTLRIHNSKIFELQKVKRKGAVSIPNFSLRDEVEIPLGRIGETTDLVGAALFLASEASSYVTGHTIVIDGGAIA
jgi:NAD(P)-dependent dehydrogenase (short-subunit alcohol dehydrogenase family)